MNERGSRHLSPKVAMVKVTNWKLSWDHNGHTDCRSPHPGHWGVTTGRTIAPFSPGRAFTVWVRQYRIQCSSARTRDAEWVFHNETLLLVISTCRACRKDVCLNAIRTIRQIDTKLSSIYISHCIGHAYYLYEVWRLQIADHSDLHTRASDRNLSLLRASQP